MLTDAEKRDITELVEWAKAELGVEGPEIVAAAIRMIAEGRQAFTFGEVNASKPLRKSRVSLVGGPLVDALREWRSKEAKARKLPAYVVLHDKAIAAIAATPPTTEAELSELPGIGPAKIKRYGEVLLKLIAAQGKPTDDLPARILAGRATLYRAIKAKRGQDDDQLREATGLPEQIFMPALTALEAAGKVVERDGLWRVVKKGT